jgi:uncharacterized integral membrane protein
MTDRSGPPEERHGFRTNPRQIAAGVSAILLLAFILANNDEAPISFLFWEATVPLWFGLAVAAVLGGAVGFLFGGRRQKRKLRR